MVHIFDLKPQFQDFDEAMNSGICDFYTRVYSIPQIATAFIAAAITLAQARRELGLTQVSAEYIDDQKDRPLLAVGFWQYLAWNNYPQFE